MKLSIAFALLALSAGVGHAQDDSAALYHVQQDTFGCANPSYTRTLTNPQEKRRGNRRWVRTAMTEGRCVTITPRSPWKLVSLEGDVALMAYAGGSGPPGAYYLNVTDLVDGAGHHPDGSAAAAAPAPAPSPDPAAPPQSQVDSTSATALAPPPVPDSAEQPADMDLPPPLPAKPSALSEISWILAGAGFIALAAILIWHTKRLNRIERNGWANEGARFRVPSQVERDRDQYPGGGPGGYPAGGGGGGG